ncbi:MAG: HAD family phosphatase [Planctomycetes bacterium]|nr:HAD family phosphatase [Planctomycetota bacterium]
MPRRPGIDAAHEAVLRNFVQTTSFTRCGAVITDLDGTAVHEHEGRIVIPKEVEYSLKALDDVGRPVIINTLRFPLSVLRTFGRDWYAINKKRVPTVTLNGSLLGWVDLDARGELAFEEIAAFPLAPDELDRVFARVLPLLDDGVLDLLVFCYPRDWRQGELIWTPDPERVDVVRGKYLSASAVTAEPFADFRARMSTTELCMVFTHLDLPQDRLMAYQHASRTAFATHTGVDKLTGAQALTAALGLAIGDSVGAGDTSMDRFLDGVGLALIVGRARLPFQGRHATVRLAHSHALGQLLFRLTELHGERTA